MRQIYIFTAVAIVLVSAVGTIAQGKFTRYTNGRFEYSVEYPTDLVPGDEPQNGDGRVFTLADGKTELRVWGQYNALFDSLKNAYARDIKERGAGVTYKLLGTESYVISGSKDGRIYYQKTIRSGKDGDAATVFATFVLEYDASDKAKYAATVAKISRSFKFLPDAGK